MATELRHNQQSYANGTSGSSVAIRLDAQHTSPRDGAQEPAELQAQERLAVLGRLAAGVTHDFNNLLTAILGAGDVLASQIPHDDPRHIFVEQVQLAARKGATLIQQLQALSKKELPRLARIDLTQIVTRLEPLLAHLLGRGVILEQDLAGDLPPIDADPAQIEQVLMNLALNARDAMPTGGTLQISTAHVCLAQPLTFNQIIPAGNYVALKVTDNGTGMDADIMRRLFEPFFTTKPPGVGSGLGLVNVQNIVKTCRGHILATSQKNQGTTFTLYFPVAPRSLARSRT